jgi:hypothetical protein
MKTLYRAAFSAAIIFSIHAGAQEGPSQVPVQFTRTYAPLGFDDNDNIQIVGEGAFPNSCYRQAETKVAVDHPGKTITLAPTAYKYGGMCLQVILPYDHVVDIGLLQKGTYTIVQDGKSIGHIDIRKSAVRDPDDYMYAPISQAYFQSRGTSNQVYLTGDFPLSCWKLKQVKFDIQPDVLVIQPIAEVDPSLPCTPGKFHFETATEVGSMKPGRYLLHVRSMNGKSVNNLIDIR